MSSTSFLIALITTALRFDKLYEIVFYWRAPKDRINLYNKKSLKNSFCKELVHLRFMKDGIP